MFDPREILGTLIRHQVEFVLIGGVAATLYGCPEQTFDLDILYAGDLRIDTGPVLLPHPRAAARRFVLQPLADIRPDLVLHGRAASVAELLALLPSSPAVRLFAREW